MWTRDVAGPTGIAVAALYLSFYLLPATEVTDGALWQIANERRSIVDQLDELDRASPSLRTGAQANAEAGPADGAPLVRTGPNLLDGIVWGSPGGG